jgi:hypothetical protein
MPLPKRLFLVFLSLVGAALLLFALYTWFTLSWSY